MSGDEHAARWSIVVVLHNSRDALRECVLSVPAAAELVIVDNDSSDGGADLVRELRPDARVVRQPNLGFGAGCNTGARHAGGELLLFLNPDAALGDDTLAVLAAVLDAHPGSLVGPRIEQPDGSVQHAIRRPIRARYDIAELLPQSPRWLPDALRRDLPPSDPVYRDGGIVPCVQGSCFAVARDRYLAIGGCDERLFLYGEEDHLARAIRAAGGDVRYEPATAVQHIGATSTSEGEHLGAFATHHLYRSYVMTYAARRGRAYACAAAVAIAALVPVAVAEDRAREIRGRSVPPVRTRLSILTGIASGLRAVLTGRARVATGRSVA